MRLVRGARVGEGVRRPNAPDAIGESCVVVSRRRDRPVHSIESVRATGPLERDRARRVEANAGDPQSRGRVVRIRASRSRWRLPSLGAGKCPL